MMGDKTKHLVRVGHEFAAAMSDDTPIITIAKMVTELASALDVQSARSDALAAKLNDVCAENAALKSALNPEVIPEAAVEAFTETAIMDHDWNDTSEWSWVENDTDVIRAVLEAIKPNTPATDAWVNKQRAVGVDGAIEKLITMLNHQSTGVSASINVLRTFAAQLRGGQV